MGEKNIAEAVRKLGQSNDEVYAKVCEVLKVHQSDKTIDVKPIDDTAEIYNVRLQAESETGGLVLYPKKGSMVLVVFINKNNAAVVNTSEIEKFSLVIDPCTLEVDKTGFLLKKQNETMKKLMKDLIKACKQLKFTTNTGSTIQLINIQDFIDVENRFDNFFK